MATDGAEIGDRLARRLLAPLAVALVAIIVVFYVLFGTAQVDGESMEPTLLPVDHLLVTKGYKTPSRGDIVILHVLESDGTVHDIVKRVIALPGDTIEVRQDIAFVNGVQEPDRGQFIDPTQAVSMPPRTVPESQLWVMGDNRPVSLDSRYIGTVPLADVQGRVVGIFTPIGRIRLVH